MASQPKQKLKHKQIQDFINHDHTKDNIYLFLRTSKNRDYTYLGKLAYLTHDPTREMPVYFKWQILDWYYTPKLLSKMGLKLVKDEEDIELNSDQEKNKLIATQPPKKDSLEKEKPIRNFMGRKFDFVENEQKNHTLGKAGELLVVQMEKEFLERNGRKDLAQLVDHVSSRIGDGTGFDILSYDINGNKKFIEVKTTCGGKGTPFFLSANELAFAERNPENYFIYRIYNFDMSLNKGEYYILSFEDLQKLNKEPTCKLAHYFRIPFSNYFGRIRK
jgi:hypothetical protein